MSEPKSDRNLIRIAVSVDSNDYDRISAIASALDVSIAWLIRKAMTEFLDNFSKSNELKIQIKNEKE